MEPVIHIVEARQLTLAVDSPGQDHGAHGLLHQSVDKDVLRALMKSCPHKAVGSSPADD